MISGRRTDLVEDHDRYRKKHALAAKFAEAGSCRRQEGGVERCAPVDVPGMYTRLPASGGETRMPSATTERLTGKGATRLTLDDVDELVDRRVATDVDVCVGHAVLAQDGLDLVGRDLGERDRVGDRDSSLLLLLDRDVGRSLVQADAEAFQFVLDDGFVGERLEDVEDDEDQVAGSGDGDDLSTATLAVLGALDDTGQVENLDGCAVYGESSGYAANQGRVSGDAREQSGEGRRFGAHVVKVAADGSWSVGVSE